MAKLAKNIYLIVCDDVRREVGNKLSFMGVYGTDIIVKDFPAQRPLLTFVAVFEEIKKKLENNFLINVKLPGESAFSTSLQPNPNTKVGGNTNLIVALGPVNFIKEDFLRVEVRNEDDNKLIIKKDLKIVKVA